MNRSYAINSNLDCHCEPDDSRVKQSHFIGDYFVPRLNVGVLVMTKCVTHIMNYTQLTI